jgi:FlaG/FlaF family flagellin (archaellin)
MIAVVVILAAVVGAFATGIFGSQQDAPQAAFTIDGDTATMSSGESIPTDRLSAEGTVSFDDGGDGTMDAGDSVSGLADDNGDGQITIVWTSEDGGNSATLASFDA